MFARNNPPRGLRLLKEYFYPAMGYRRTLRYMWHRISRLSDTTVSIAAGLSIGAAISFTPLVGTHFIQAMGISYFFRVNILASLVGTFWGNPWTFPFLWVFGYQTGSKIFAAFGMYEFTDIPNDLSMGVMWNMILEQPLNLFVPWMLGGYLCALMFWPFAFAGSYYLIKEAKLVRRKRRRKVRARKGQGTKP